MRLCAFCQKDLSSASDSFSAPVGSDGAFKDFCSQGCMKKYEDLLNSDVEIIRVEQGKARPSNKCSVCQKVSYEITKITAFFALWNFDIDQTYAKSLKRKEYAAKEYF